MAKNKQAQNLYTIRSLMVFHINGGEWQSTLETSFEFIHPFVGPTPNYPHTPIYSIHGATLALLSDSGCVLVKPCLPLSSSNVYECECGCVCVCVCMCMCIYCQAKNPLDIFNNANFRPAAFSLTNIEQNGMRWG